MPSPCIEILKEIRVIKSDTLVYPAAGQSNTAPLPPISIDKESLLVLKRDFSFSPDFPASSGGDSASPPGFHRDDDITVILLTVLNPVFTLLVSSLLCCSRLISSPAPQCILFRDTGL